MRVLFVNHTSRISGGELSLISLFEAIQEEISATFACPEGPLASQLRQREANVIPICETDGSLRVHPTATPRAALQLGRAAMQVRKLAAASEVDVIHANSIRAGLIAVGGATRRRPTVIHVRDCLPPSRMTAPSLRVLNRADTLIANSHYTLSALGAISTRAKVVHNAVDISRFETACLTPAEARVRLGLGKLHPVLAVIAQITPWKAQDDAIRIAAKLVDAHPELQLLLVGSPKFVGTSTRYDNTAYFESLRELVADLGLIDNVRFLGERDDIPEILRAVDVLLAPSWEEPFGRTVIEAMASGIPVAATDVGGPPEILESSNCGLLLPPRRPGLWADEVGRLLVNPTERAEMGRRGRATARERFEMAGHVEAILEIYERLLSKRPAAKARHLEPSA